MIHDVQNAADSALRSYFGTAFSGLFVEALKHKEIRLEKVVLLEEEALRAIAAEAASAAINVLVNTLS